MVEVLENCMVPVGRQAFPKLNPATGFGLMVMGFENNVLWQPEEVSTLSVTVKFPVEEYVCNWLALVVAVTCVPSPKSQYHFDRLPTDAADESVNLTDRFTQVVLAIPNLAVGGLVSTTVFNTVSETQPMSVITEYFTGKLPADE